MTSLLIAFELPWIFTRLTPLALLDIFVVAVIFFWLLTVARGTRAMPLLRGIAILLGMIAVLSTTLNLTALRRLLEIAFPALVIAVPVIFQPELRRALEQLGQTRTWLNLPFAHTEEDIEKTIDEISRAVVQLSRQRIGALIVIERETGLQEYADRGVPEDAILTRQTLIQIFTPNTPLHDGAVIVRQNRILAAACRPAAHRGADWWHARHAPPRGGRHQRAVGRYRHRRLRGDRADLDGDGRAARARPDARQAEGDAAGAAPGGSRRSRRHRSAAPLPARSAWPAETSQSEKRRRHPMASVRQQTNRPMSSGVVSRAVLAVVLAFGFWAWVTNNNNPDRSRDFPNIPVTQTDLPDGLSVTDYSPQVVTVSIWGPRSVVINPSLQAGNFAATIDLKDVRPGIVQVPVHVQSTLSGLRKKSASPSDIKVTIERTIDKTLPVTVPMPTQPGVKVNSITASPSDVHINGPESKVNAVTQVAAAFDIGDRTTTFTSPPVDVKALDASGREVSGVTLSPSRVTVAADLTDNRNERVVPVSTADVVGTPAPGYIFNGFSSLPQVTITGDPQLIRTILNIPTQPINIDGLKQAATLTVQLDTSKLPSGVTIKDNVTSVQVQANIVEITQDVAIKLPIQPVNSAAGLAAIPLATGSNGHSAGNAAATRSDQRHEHPRARQSRQFYRAGYKAHYYRRATADGQPGPDYQD